MSSFPPPPGPPPTGFPPPEFPQAPPPEFPLSAGRAGFGARLGASVIDSAVTLVIVLVLGRGSPAMETVSWVIGLAIYCIMVGRGQSIGHRATRIRIVDSASGSGISAARALGRRVVSIVSALVFYLGFLWMLWDKDKQTWHDKILHTYVVKA